MSRAGPPRSPAPASWDDDKTIVWSPPDWDPDESQGPPSGTPAAVAAPPETVVITEAPQRPHVEVEVRKISPAAVLHVRRAYEIWTKHRVYGLDAQLVCIEVIDLATGQTKDRHPFVGARLVGGQIRNGEQNELAFPLPTIGSEAVFQKADEQKRIRLATTSKVTRVILHVHRVEVRGDERDQAWGRITSGGR